MSGASAATKAVSDAATAAAARRIAASSRPVAKATTPARLPAPGVRVKASTMLTFMAGSYPRRPRAPLVQLARDRWTKPDFTRRKFAARHTFGMEIREAEPRDL